MTETFLAPMASAGRKRVKGVRIDDVPGKFSKLARKFTCAVATGPETGYELAKTVGTELRSGTSYGKFVVALMGREPAIGEEVDVADLFLDREFDVLLVPGSDGNGAILESIKPVDVSSDDGGFDKTE